MTEPRIRLITRGDDLGSNHSANSAIQEAFRQGILRNTSIMAPCAALEEAADMLAGEPSLCCGLHTTMNAEWDRVRWGPVLPPERVPTLVDRNGHLFQTTKALRDNHPSIDEIFFELQAQLDKARAAGFDVRYADQHMGWSRGLDGVGERFERWCEREGLLNAQHYGQRLPRVDVEGDAVDHLIAALQAAAPGQYLTVGHPAYDNAEMRALGHDGYPGDVVGPERDGQRRMFMDSRILRFCQTHGVAPIRYDEAMRLR